MEDIKSIIRVAKVSSEYINLTNYYSSKSIFSIIGDDRSEKMHSNFLAWLLNPQEEHGLGIFPIKSFLLLLSTAKTKRKDINKDSRLNEPFEQSFLTEAYEIYNVSIKREYSTGLIGESKKNNKGYIDILIEIDIEIGSDRKVLPIIIENKVKSKENNYQDTAKCQQTELYFNWGEREYNDEKVYFQPIYVFLTVSGDKATQPDYVNISYQDMVDNVLSPCLIKKPTAIGAYHIKQYLRCLSYSHLGEDNRREDDIMAFEPKEKELVKKFFEANKPLFIAVANCLKDDDETPAEDKKILETFVTVVKDYSRYVFNEKIYGKSRLVLAVVTQYFEDNNNITFEGLQRAFPDKLQGSTFGVVRLETNINQRYRGKFGTISPRYFISEPIVLSSGERVLVCNQWGYNYEKKEGNFEPFLENARKLGYDIKKV